MKIFYASLVIFSAVFLFMLPITGMVYDFRTDVRQDSFTVETAAAVTTANTTLLRAIFGDDTATISYDSSIDESPAFSAYNAATRQLLTANLTASSGRTLLVSYDVAALSSTSLDMLIDRVPLIWLLMIISFAPAALASMFVGRN